jgi:hypothetical protein
MVVFAIVMDDYDGDAEENAVDEILVKMTETSGLTATVAG